MFRTNPTGCTCAHYLNESFKWHIDSTLKRTTVPTYFEINTKIEVIVRTSQDGCTIGTSTQMAFLLIN